LIKSPQRAMSWPACNIEWFFSLFMMCLPILFLYANTSLHFGRYLSKTISSCQFLQTKIQIKFNLTSQPWGANLQYYLQI
jgi:hypothetical protein